MRVIAGELDPVLLGAIVIDRIGELLGLFEDNVVLVPVLVPVAVFV